MDLILSNAQTRMTHAMVCSGVDVVDGRPWRWQVEKSWDEKVGEKGCFLMNDAWFDDEMFEMATPRSCRPICTLELAPIVVPPWDPRGSLAG